MLTSNNAMHICIIAYTYMITCPHANVLVCMWMELVIGLEKAQIRRTQHTLHTQYKKDKRINTYTNSTTCTLINKSTTIEMCNSDKKALCIFSGCLLFKITNIAHHSYMFKVICSNIPKITEYLDNKNQISLSRL